MVNPLDIQRWNISDGNFTGDPRHDEEWYKWYEWYANIGKTMDAVATVTLVVVGLICNTLSIIMMTKTSFRRLSSGVYLLLLAIFDITFNLVTAAQILFYALSGTFFNDRAACKISVYLINVSITLSSWMIVAVSVERLVAVILPHKATTLSTRKNAWKASAIIIAILVPLNIYSFFIYDIPDEPNPECFLSDEFNNNVAGIAFGLLHLMVYSLVPSLIIIVSNVILIRKVRQSVRNRNEAGIKDEISDETKSLICTLILVSTVFVVCTLPLSGFLISDFIPPEQLYSPTTRELWFSICSVLMKVNHSVNFLLYFMSSRKSRQEFCRFVCCKKESERGLNDSTMAAGTSISMVERK